MSWVHRTTDDIGSINQIHTKQYNLVLFSQKVVLRPSVVHNVQENIVFINFFFHREMALFCENVHKWSESGLCPVGAGACGLTDHMILGSLGSTHYCLPSGTNLSHNSKRQLQLSSQNPIQTKDGQLHVDKLGKTVV